MRDVAIITTRQEVCDVCKAKDREVERYKVGPVGKVRTVVLCAEHAKPIVDLQTLLLKVGTPGVSPRKGKVRTVDEIEEILEARKAARGE